MRHCVLCETDRVDVSLVQVVPASWTGFHQFVEICAECRGSERFQKLVKQRKIVTASQTKVSAAPTTAPAPAVPANEGDLSTRAGSIEIAHRRTGAVLHLVDAATLAAASLGGAALSGADLHGAGLSGADLRRADLRLADLGGADLRNADLRETNLRGADLCGADLRGAKLQRADMSHAVYDDATRWPVGFDAAACGARRGLR